MLPRDTQRCVVVGRVGCLPLQGKSNGLCAATFAFLAQLGTRYLVHHVFQVADGCLLFLGGVCHDDMRGQEDVRAYARLSPTLAMANELHWVGLAWNARAWYSSHLTYDHTLANICNLLIVVDRGLWSDARTALFEPDTYVTRPIRL